MSLSSAERERAREREKEKDRLREREREKEPDRQYSQTSVVLRPAASIWRKAATAFGGEEHQQTERKEGEGEKGMVAEGRDKWKMEGGRKEWMTDCGMDWWTIIK